MTQYCFEQHYAYVNPIDHSGFEWNRDALTDTNLDDCIEKIEERTGFKLESGQVVHTFGGTTATSVKALMCAMRSLPILLRIEISSRVFSKRTFLTGWDCPRAETMMSFKHANDATYIAQLLGRMVRTPMQMHIQVDDVLNDVHLYLPYFNEDTVKDVVEALQRQKAEIFRPIFMGVLSGKKFETQTVRPKKKKEEQQTPDR